MARAMDGMTALITGGGGGIGRATAAVLVRDGAHVVVSGRTESKLDAVVARHAAEAAEAGGSIRPFVCDNLDEDQVRRAIDFAMEPTGRLDAAVAVPGGGAMKPVLRMSVEMLEEIMRRNITSMYVLLKHSGSTMIRQGTGGSFVGVSSMQGIQPAPMFSAYCAAKAGLEMLVRCAAEELGRHKIRVNAVRPGLTRTDATVGMFAHEATVAAYMEQQPIDRDGESEDIAGAIRYFAGPESTWTTGQCLTVDGGCSLRRFPDLTPLHQLRLGDELEKAAHGVVD
jgi:NAD(P)-dependent dehydrogenase (short-subunit alcohol dehydrogenase family)